MNNFCQKFSSGQHISPFYGFGPASAAARVVTAAKVVVYTYSSMLSLDLINFRKGFARVYAKNLSRKNLEGILTSRAIEKLQNLNSIENSIEAT